MTDGSGLYIILIFPIAAAIFGLFISQLGTVFTLVAKAIRGRGR